MIILKDLFCFFVISTKSTYSSSKFVLIFIYEKLFVSKKAQIYTFPNRVDKYDTIKDILNDDYFK